MAEARGPEHEAVCHRCWDAELRPREACVKCGSERVACRRTDTGGALCPQCWFDERPAARCPYCKQMRKLMRREDGDWLCGTEQPKRACATCGAIARIAERIDDERGICPRCYERAHRVAS